MLQLSILQPNNLDVYIQLGRIYVGADAMEEAKKVLAIFLAQSVPNNLENC